MVTKTKQIYNGFMSRVFSRVVQSTTCVNISSSPLYRGCYRCEHLQDVQSLGELVCLRVYNWNLNRRFVVCISSRSFQLKVGTGENCTFFGDTVLQMENTKNVRAFRFFQVTEDGWPGQVIMCGGVMRISPFLEYCPQASSV